MSKILRLILLCSLGLVLTLTLSTLNVSAIDDVKSSTERSNVNVSKGTYEVLVPISMRKDPENGYEKLSIIPVGEKIEVTETKEDKISGTWGKISYDGRDGWIYLDLEQVVPVTSGSNSTPSGSSMHPSSELDTVSDTDSMSSISESSKSTEVSSNVDVTKTGDNVNMFWICLSSLCVILCAVFVCKFYMKRCLKR